jgi:hypothetical protein
MDVLEPATNEIRAARAAADGVAPTTATASTP